MECSSDLCAIGGNRYPHAADWAEPGLAFGAGHCLALWNQATGTSRLHWHKSDITAVSYLSQDGKLFIASGSEDGLLKIRAIEKNGVCGNPSEAQLAQDSSLHVIAHASEDLDWLFAATADGRISCVSLGSSEMDEIDCRIFLVFTLSPRIVPLALAATRLQSKGRSCLLAVGGSNNAVQLVGVSSSSNGFKSEVLLVLAGHEGWIRSLAFTEGISAQEIFLASASQDRYVRVWNISPSQDQKALQDPKVKQNYELQLFDDRLAFKDQSGASYLAKLDALLVGHEDWVYTVRWEPKNSWPKRILTASADNSLGVWEIDPGSGIWIATQRLGAISQQKGSTTATGSAGGFWQGLWSPDGGIVTSLGKTGSWRLWQIDQRLGEWRQLPGPSGHTKAVTSIAWAENGAYLLSVSTDQTTRLWAQATLIDSQGWHELSRCQIHGYDLNCIDMVSDTSFVSGADEKPMRVFELPLAVALRLQRVCGVKSLGTSLPAVAGIPVLGLSNKTIEVEPEMLERETDMDSGFPEPQVSTGNVPIEDELARKTLWPETEKLYGHGYEVCTVACSHDGKLIASACRASSIDHAVIRIFRTSDWFEVKPSLKGHLLTVTSLRFSGDDKYLLSGSRDRQCIVWKRTNASSVAYELLQAILKAHSKMILGVAWAPVINGFSLFATAGRDSRVRMWTTSKDGETGHHSQEWVCGPRIPIVEDAAAITALDFHAASTGKAECLLAYGTESGSINILLVNLGSDATGSTSRYLVRAKQCAAGHIRALRWRPEETRTQSKWLAVASHDNSVQILKLELPSE